MNEYHKISEGILGEETIEKTNTELFLSLVGHYFPEAIKDGEVDFTALKEEMGEFHEVGSEHYDFTWAGKQSAKKEAQSDIFGRTLKYKPQDSLNPDTTENIYIEGDNLEALKLLRRNYHGKIKMIYIDPPYNTGNDFVYHDNFAMTEEELANLSGDIENGVRLKKNPKDNARYHTNWLNMMYPRLKIARDLLSEDGVVFISIDDNEVANLQKMCNEIFGANNAIGPIIQNKFNAKNDTVDIQKNHEYILVYRKATRFMNGRVLPTLMNKRYTYRDVFEENGEYYYLNDSITTRGEGGTLIARPNLGYTVYYNPVTKDKIAVSDYDFSLLKTTEDIYTDDTELIKKGYYPIRPPRVRGQLGVWTWALDKFNEKKKYIVITGKEGSYSVKKRTFVDKDKVVAIDGKKKYLSETLGNSKSILEYSTNEGSIALSSLMNTVFNNPKNIEMIKYLIKLINDNDFTILDFFSGSSTTAHAVMQLNAEDGGNRKFIMVQLPEETDEKSEAYNAGYKNICEIGKERIRRAAKKIHEDNPDAKFDDGFKVFKVDDTNIRWNTTDDEELISLADIDYSTGDKDNIDFTPGHNDIDIVYEIMLRQFDIPLSTPIEKLPEVSDRTYIFADAVVVCLEPEIDEKLIEKLASIEPVPGKFVLRDSAFNDEIELKDVSYRRLSALIANHQLEGERKNRRNNYTVEFI